MFEVITCVILQGKRDMGIIAPLTLTAENRCVILDCISGNLSADRDHVQWNPLDFTLLMIKGMTATLSAPDIDWQVEMTPVDFVSEIIVKMTQVCFTQCFYSLTLLVTSLSHLCYRASLKFYTLNFNQQGSFTLIGCSRNNGPTAAGDHMVQEPP